MRAVTVMLVVPVAFCALGLSSCAGESKPPSADTLVLELGGDHGSLRGALLRAGVVIEPRRTPVKGAMRSMGEILGTDQPGPQPIDPPPEPEPKSQPVPSPQPSPVPSPSYREVELRPGETISHLSSLHLGTVRRYREILELNSWTEEQIRRLPAGTKVKLPLE